MINKSLDWLNQNRFRAYPFENDKGLIQQSSNERLPTCILLDCLIMDTRELDSLPALVFTEVDIQDSGTTVKFSYAGREYTHTIAPSNNPEDQGDIDNSESSFVRVSSNTEDPGLYMSFVFSSHEYILATAGVSRWNINAKVLPSKIISIEARGVTAISAKGSQNTPGYDTAGVATGDIHLTDGYRTQPVISGGRVVVKVGTSYGENPCSEHYSNTPVEATCEDMLLFFCGQNAITSGNTVLQGGPGVDITQGSGYTAKEDILDSYGNIGISKGETVPCIEISASSELLRIYRPSQIDTANTTE